MVAVERWLASFRCWSAGILRCFRPSLEQDLPHDHFSLPSDQPASSDVDYQAWPEDLHVTGQDTKPGEVPLLVQSGDVDDHASD